MCLYMWKAALMCFCLSHHSNKALLLLHRGCNSILCFSLKLTYLFWQKIFTWHLFAGCFFFKLWHSFLFWNDFFCSIRNASPVLKSTQRYWLLELYSAQNLKAKKAVSKTNTGFISNYLNKNPFFRDCTGEQVINSRLYML